MSQSTTVPPFYKSVVEKRAAQKKFSTAKCQFNLEAKRMMLQKAIDGMIHPTQLWERFIEFRWKGRKYGEGDPEGEDQGPANWNDVRITYKGYRKAALTLLHTEEEYRKNSFLSPSVFAFFYQQQSGKKLFVQSDEQQDEKDVDAAFLNGSSLWEPDEFPIDVLPLFQHVAKKILLFDLRARLELSATGPNHTLTQEDIEQFIVEIIPRVRLVRDAPPWMIPYYLCHASQKFMFMLDPNGVGHVDIATFMRSEVFAEFLRLCESDAKDAMISFAKGTGVELAATFCGRSSDDDGDKAIVMDYEHTGEGENDLYTVLIVQDFLSQEERSTSDESSLFRKVPRGCLYWSPEAPNPQAEDPHMLSNWFSLPVAARVYTHFISLNVNRDGMLTSEEMQGYNNSSFTKLAIDRVFEVHVRGSAAGRMNYNRYLDFVLATEHPAARASLNYFWRILDLEETHQFIKCSVLRQFCKEISEALYNNGMLDISQDSILSELIDMIDPSYHEHITKQDLLRSKQFSTILPVLLDFRLFFQYDRREQLAAGGVGEAEMSDSQGSEH